MSHLRLIRPEAAASASTGSSPNSARPASDTWYVIRDYVTVRSGPGTTWPAVGQLHYLDSGTQLSETTNWVQLRLRSHSASGLPAGSTAWVAKAHAALRTHT
ncbi:hypothetical protein [Streptomyces sp. S1D4-20]|uniref:hypothetical protein n=1 Tax=Streptomyces sp. S1D4-20 TaxID=2594462 RepID=UPI001164285F|nr:hypothetical protein [Streptomyces sp. S1D4-20]QDN54197.1 hypothetical protein FNV67_01100 [Streptomyces sp. S1D4-20]